jgi:trehalose-6-phosphatase
MTISLLVNESAWHRSASESLSTSLRRALIRVARVPRLLVATGYDGTLAPIAADHEQARPLPESVRALRMLAGLHDTTAAVISSRALQDLAVLSRLPAEVRLVGSLGSEFDTGAVPRPGVTVTEGDAVIELAVLPTDKGGALDRLRHQTGASATVFIGDGDDDERAFARLAGPDLGVKVGTGPSAAVHEVDDPVAVAAALAFLAEERRAWLHGESSPPIERHSMLANGTSVALVTPDAGVTWMCHPGPDSAAVFAQLVGGANAGHFTVRPLHGGLPLGQRYVPGTMTVQTRWSRLLVTDYLGHGLPAHRTDVVRVISGSASASITFAPRPEFGQVPVRLLAEPDGLRVVGTGDPMVLRAPGVRWRITSDGGQETAHATVTPRPDAEVVLELRCGTADLSPGDRTEAQTRQVADEYWSTWLAGLRLPTRARQPVARSALTLRGLCDAESGGIMAAATTSLPEEIGGVRNWDYRYCWLRDGALTAQALVSLGSTVEAQRYLQWLQRIVAALPGPEYLHPLYTLAGSALGAEATIDTLPGYAGSRPVRVGNLANQQVQLDVFGPVVDLIVALADARGELGADDWALATAMASAVSSRWMEPDHGIWEERHAPRHHVYSKVQCWVTIDRAITLAERWARPADPQWTLLRAEIAADILVNGWHSDAGDGIGAFTAAYDGLDLDAAALHVGLSGLLAPDDPRFVATVTAVESELRVGSTVYRYRRDDGLPGNEGGFHLCSAWLAEAYLLIGQRAEAEALFQQILATAGPTGLLPEEYDPVAERSLGNHPQAYSHLGLIRCARLLDS